MLKYNTVKLQALKWGISEGRIIKLIADGRIPTATRIGRAWVLPNVVKDPRKCPGWQLGRKRK